MSDQKKAVAFQAGGQPAQNASEGEHANVTQPTYLTREEALALAQEAEERAFRRAQGLYDSGNKKVKERLQQLEEAWKIQAQAGVQVPDDAKEKMRQMAINQALLEDEQPSSPPPATEPQAQGEGEQGEEHPVTKLAIGMMKKAGIIVNDNDPEVELLDYSDEAAFLLSINKAVEAKRARLASEGNPAPRMPGLGGASGHSAQSGLSPFERLQRYYSGGN